MQYLIASIQQHPINDTFGPHPRGLLLADPGIGEPLAARGFAVLVETRGRRRVSVLGLGQRRQRLLGVPGEERPAQLTLLAFSANDVTRAGKCAKRAGGLQRKRLQPALPLELDGLLPGLCVQPTRAAPREPASSVQLRRRLCPLRACRSIGASVYVPLSLRSRERVGDPHPALALLCCEPGVSFRQPHLARSCWRLGSRLAF